MSIDGSLEQSDVGCHIHWSGIRTLSNVCEQFTLHYDITFNDTKSKLLFLKVDFLMFLLVAFMLMDNMLKFQSVQCTLVIPYPQETEQKLGSMQT